MSLACIDVGLKRIGLALCLNGIISPQNAIMRKNRKQASKDVSEFLAGWEIEKLIVGIPKSGSSAQEMQGRIKHFVSLLNFDGEIEYTDEYGSSKEASEKMKGITRYKKDGKLDSIAACVILERYLEKSK